MFPGLIFTVLSLFLWSLSSPVGDDLTLELLKAASCSPALL